MPLEGHWDRQHTPLRLERRRVRRVVAIVIGALALGLAVVLFTALRQDSSQPAAGCVDVTAASSTGGTTLHSCGGAAARLCRREAGREDPFAREVAARCRQAGYR